ncbi:MAG: LytTR family transcriptional regulator [Candidatus Azobacteroides sp.]|nr:LytTR family transcriptional regulator [Candidatus Azobacteroides sp.]
MIYLQRKYPLVRHKLSTIALIGLGVALILYIFQPFGFNHYEGNKWAVALGFGLVTFACNSFFNYAVQKTVTGAVKKWTILYEILSIVCLLCFIAIFNFVYFSVIFTGLSFNRTLLLRVIYYTFILGLIPVIIMVLIEYNVYLNRKLSSLIDIKTEGENRDVTLSNHLIREKDLQIKLDDFLFAEVKKNDVLIYYLCGNEVKTKTLRSTITRIHDELNDPNVFRCHRSFIVNLKKMQSAKGNSNGYQIYLSHYKKSIPVSRKYVDELKQFIY